MTIIDRRHSVSEGIAIKAPCRAATTADVVLAGEQIIDGVVLAEGDRVLVRSQTDGTQNGIYAVSSGNWTRTRDFDGAFDIVKGTVARVTDGSANIGYWEVVTENPIAVGATLLAFAVTTNSISGVSPFVQTLLDDTTAAAFLATLGIVMDPAGTVKAFAGSAEPAGFLFCYGQAVSRAAYPALFSAIGGVYGAGDGSTTFNVPDLRGRVIAGLDDMGGGSANRLTAQTGGLNGDTLGATGGTETHTLTVAEMPSHTHIFTGSALPPHSHTELAFSGSNQTAAGGNPPGGGNAGTNTGATSAGTPVGSNSDTGGGGAHNNVQPTIVLNYIIKI